MRDLPPPRFVLSLILVGLSIQLTAANSTLWIINVLFSPVGPEDANVLQKELPPLIIVPGHTGNHLEAKLNKPDLVHWLCMKRSRHYFMLWLNLNMFLPIGIDCWIDNMRRVYNRTTGRSSNAPGVETRVPGFGKTCSVEYLDSLKLTGYFHTLVQFLVNMGYTRDETVRAAPYDWRVAPYEQEEYFDKLKELIEEMYMTYGKSVFLLGHSMGNLYISHFLHQQPQAWKDKFVHSFISLGAPWGGTVKSLAVLASVPGDLGNQLEAKLNKPSVVHYLCAKKTEDYFTLWLNLELLLPLVIDCWIDNMRLVYNTTTKTTETPPGVDVRIPGFGKTYPMEFLDPSKRAVGIYFYTLVKYMVDWGYLRDEDIRGAPYDWRRAPNENAQFFKDLQAMIESMYKQYGSPVVLIAHSMGNLYTLYFLNHLPQEWKDKYIKSYIALGAPWGGVSKTLRVLATGDNDRIPVISPLKIREQQRTAVSTNWLLPYNNTWSMDKVFITTPTYNYTMKDYQKFYQDINFKEGWFIRQDTEALVYNLTAPGVTIYCLYGTGIPTPESFKYDVFPDQEPKVINGEGDGTVNLLSGLKCKEWVGKQEGKVYMKELPGNEHVDMLSNLSTISYIKKVLFNLPLL